MMRSTPFICAGCVRAVWLEILGRATLPQTRRHFSRTASRSLPAHNAGPNASSNDSPHASDSVPDHGSDPEPGAMARRLQQATEDALQTGGRAGRRAIEEAGFSEELKAKLLDKVAGAKFEQENSAALLQAGITSRIPDSAGLGTRTIASAQPWTGEESTEDAVLRMLEDAHKPLAPGLRGKSKPPMPGPVDMRFRREVSVSPGKRASSARDRAQAYAGMGMNDKGLSEEEREAMKREFRERFTPVARAVPNSISALAALANERIEDAIARGQFKNIPRGKGIERDTRADNPFIDTTEYIMNKMIKRQDIVPPWIEKQQELIKAAENFRSRLRNDWKRHAARMIASRGGTLEQQIARATAYARAEEVHNPRRTRNPEQISVPTNSTEDVVMLQLNATTSPTQTPSAFSSFTGDQPTATEPDATITRPFRDPAWETAEKSYMTLAISNLNNLTRSYNLMAPELAKKPYFSLERELKNCFADVAPQLAEEIRLRATKPAKSLVNSPFGGSAGGQLGKGLGGLLSGSSGVRVVESQEKHYGLKEFWRDLWRKKA